MAADHGLDVRRAFLPTGSVQPGTRSWPARENAARSLKRAVVTGVRTAGEHGRVTEVDLAARLDRYDVTSELSRQRLRKLNRGARGAAWWNAFRNEVSAPYLGYACWGPEPAHALQVAGSIGSGLPEAAQNEGALTIGAVGAVAAGLVDGPRSWRWAALARRSPPLGPQPALGGSVIRQHIWLPSDQTTALAQYHLLHGIAGLCAWLHRAFTLSESGARTSGSKFCFGTGRGGLAIPSVNGPWAMGRVSNSEALLVPLQPKVALLLSCRAWRRKCRYGERTSDGY